MKSAGTGKPHKCLKAEWFPNNIQALPHVMTLIDKMAMPVKEAAVVAASTGQAQWLQALLPRIESKPDDVALCFMEIGSEFGHCNVIETVHKWWGDPPELITEDVYQPLSKAVEGGHRVAVFLLMTLFQWELGRVVTEAQDAGRQDMMELICQHGDYACFCNLAAIKILLPRCDLQSANDVRYLRNAITDAASEGFLDVVKFLDEKCGYLLYEEHYYDAGSEAPLIAAIIAGKLEVATYLYSHEGYAEDTIPDALSSAVECGHLKVVELFHEDGRYTGDSLDVAFVRAADCGQLEIVEFFLSKGQVTTSTLDEAFMTAAGSC